jgi:hypothetical protein
MIIVPKNWATFQHYKDRSPAWIKLHRSILDDYEFSCLPVASRALAPLLWLLASEYEEGRIEASEEKLAFRFRLSLKELRSAIKPLIDVGFFIDASGALADRKHDASLEKERERQEQKERERETRARFDEFWSLFPNKVGKGAAEKAFRMVEKSKSVDFPFLLDALRRYAAKTDDRKWCNPATWLNQSRWTDQPAEVVSGKSLMGALDRFDENLAQMRAGLALDQNPNVVQLLPPGSVPGPGWVRGDNGDGAGAIRPAGSGHRDQPPDGHPAQVQIPAKHRGSG